MLDKREELTFFEILQIFFRHRYLFVMAVAITFAIGCLYLHIATYKYTARLQLTATQQTGGMQSDQLSGLASLAGINLSANEGVSPFLLYTEGLRSRQAADSLSRNSDLMHVVFKNQWDSKQQMWHPASSWTKPLSNLVKYILGIPIQTWHPPGGAELEHYLQENVEVKKDAEKPIVTVNFAHPDPYFAVKFVRALHETMDGLLRARTLNRAESYIQYITEKLPEVTIAEHRKALTDLLSEQEKMRMMADSNVAFAAEPFGDIAVSNAPTRPVPWLILLTSIVLGSMIGGLLIAVREVRVSAVNAENSPSGLPQK